MVTATIQIGTDNFSRSRGVSMLVQICFGFTSSIFIQHDNKIMNAKSLLGMLSLGIRPGDMVTIITDGPDEQEALSALKEYLTL